MKHHAERVIYVYYVCVCVSAQEGIEEICVSPPASSVKQRETLKREEIAVQPPKQIIYISFAT